MANKDATLMANLLIAANEMAERDFALNRYTREDLSHIVVTRLTKAARKKVVPKLIASGLSQDQVAALIGVNTSTIQRDLGTKPESSKKSEPVEAKSPNDETKSSKKSEPVEAKSPNDDVTNSVNPQTDAVVHASSPSGIATRFVLRVNAGKAVMLAKEAIEEIEPIVDTLSENEIAVLTERALEAANYWTRVANLVRRQTDNPRGHIEVVS